uniref:Uncharacterized protein n=1 Tax=Romanomermis culicivorax TaxID=13658 RepID=A0A915HTF3_ROMCU
MNSVSSQTKVIEANSDIDQLKKYANLLKDPSLASYSEQEIARLQKMMMDPAKFQSLPIIDKLDAFLLER